MKQIRRNVFETNSSSTHSITMCSKDEYNKWENGELYLNRWGDGFKTRDELVEMLKTSTYYSTKELRYPNTDWNNTDEVNDIIRKEGWLTEEQYWDDVDMETFCESYTTSSGEEVMAFGYYGYDG